MLPGSEFVLSCAILLPDQLEEEEVEDEDEEADREPEDGRESSELVAVTVKRDDVMLVSRSWNIGSDAVELKNGLNLFRPSGKCYKTFCEKEMWKVKFPSPPEKIFKDSRTRLKLIKNP